MGISHGDQATLQISIRAAGHARLEERITLRADQTWPVLRLSLRRGDGPDKQEEQEEANTEGRLPAGLRGPGLISWCWPLPPNEGVNTEVCRGVPVTPGGKLAGASPVDEEGRFWLLAPWRDYPLCFHRRDAPPQWFLPVKDAADSHVPVPGGNIVGRVMGLAPEALPHVYVVLFTSGLLGLLTFLWVPAQRSSAA